MNQSSGSPGGTHGPVQGEIRNKFPLDILFWLKP